MNNINKVIYQLREQGHSVETYRRPDGGVRIIGIDGMKFAKSGAEGNNLGRSMTGTFMSKAQISQRRKANKAVIRFTESQRRIVKKAQRMVKKIGKKTKDSYRLLAKNLKQRIKKEGWKAAKKAISNILIHKQGGAYPLESDWWSQTLSQVEMPMTSEWLRRYPNRVTWEAINKIHDLYYAAIHRQLTFEQADRQAMAFLRNKQNWFRG